VPPLSFDPSRNIALSYSRSFATHLSTIVIFGAAFCDVPADRTVSRRERANGKASGENESERVW
jgi:hypothetical protein